MASSVNRRVEGYLSRVMGQRDPAGLIRPRSTEPIRACGLAPRHQAGHMTAIGPRSRHVKKILASRGPSTHGPWAFSPRTGSVGIHAFGRRNKGVDTRIKSAQDYFGLIPASLKGGTTARRAWLSEGW